MRTGSGESERDLDETIAAGSRDEGAVLLDKGVVLGRYVILHRVGAGAMGVVYAAYDPELDRRVALKILHPDPDKSSGSQSGGRPRLLREAQA